jgi:hypothetical protein
MIAALLASVLAVPAVVSAPCPEPQRVAVAFVDDTDAVARKSVEDALARGCFELLPVSPGTDLAVRAAAKRAGIPWVVVVRAGLVEAVQEHAHGYLFTVDLVALESAGPHKAHAQRSATLLGGAAQASGREGARVADDAVKVLKAQMAHPLCAEKSDIVVLWHKDTDATGRRAVLKALEDRCVVASKEVDGMREQAMELARDLGRPLVAFKAFSDKAGKLSVVADRIDEKSEQLVVEAHVDATDDVKAAVERTLP